MGRATASDATAGGHTADRATAGRRGKQEGRLRAVSGGGDGGRMGLAAETAEVGGGGFAEFWESEEVCEGYVCYAACHYL